MASLFLDEWRIDKGNPTPFFKQLADNIKWSIATGRAPSGCKLPTVRTMAQKLDVSVETVRSAYKFLEELQLVVTRPHHGTQVVTSSKEQINANIAPKQTNPLLDTVTAALASGYTAEELRSLLEDALDTANKIIRPKILFVECSELDVTLYGSQLASLLDIHVDSVILDQMDSFIPEFQEKHDEYQAIVTTYFHYSAVTEIFQSYNLPIYGIVVEMGPYMLNYLSSLPPHTKMGIVCTPDQSLQYLVNLVQNIRKDIDIRAAYESQTEKVTEIINWGDTFLGTHPCEVHIKERAPDKTAHFFFDQINVQSTSLLHEYLKNLAPGSERRTN